VLPGHSLSLKDRIERHALGFMMLQHFGDDIDDRDKTHLTTVKSEHGLLIRGIKHGREGETFGAHIFGEGDRGERLVIKGLESPGVRA
jgi:hypothetical protein